MAGLRFRSHILSSQFEIEPLDLRSGQGSQVKRGGRGKGNWGTAEDELKAQTDSQVSETPAEVHRVQHHNDQPKIAFDILTAQTTEAAPVEAAAEGTTEAAPAEAAVETAPAEPEGPKTFTLEEFKKQQAAAQAKLAAKPKRQANEGADLSKWGNAEVLQRDEDDVKAVRPLCSLQL